MVISGLDKNLDVSHFRLSLHLITAFIILILILWQILQIKYSHKKTNEFKNFKLPFVFLALILIQIIFGAFVSGMDAGKIYNTWPLMGSNYFPDDNKFINLFNITSLSDPSLVQFMHRNIAYAILFIYVIMLYNAYKIKLKNSYISIACLGLFLLIQIVLGILTVVSGAQIVLSSMHQITSILLVSSSVYLLFITQKN